MNKPNLIDIIIAEKIGKVLEYLVKEKSYDLYDVCSKWLYSKTFFSILDDDVSVYSQSRFYIARHFEENSGPFLQGEVNNISFSDVAYWFGYLVTYWCYSYEIKGKDISSKYNVQKIIEDYDTLHTLSVKTAIQKIMEDDYK